MIADHLDVIPQHHLEDTRAKAEAEAIAATEAAVADALVAAAMEAAAEGDEEAGGGHGSSNDGGVATGASGVDGGSDSSSLAEDLGSRVDVATTVDEEAPAIVLPPLAGSNASEERLDQSVRVWCVVSANVVAILSVDARQFVVSRVA